MAELRRFYPKKFELMAITIDMKFDDLGGGRKPTDYSEVEELCRRIHVEYRVVPSNIATIVFDIRKENNPCSLCAKLRRGMLHSAALELGCNKVALGHHLDDAIETFYMNLWQEGRIGCFSPVTTLSRRELTLIRPMLLATENDVVHAVRNAGLPIVKSRCPADGATLRQSTKDFVHTMMHKDPAFRQKMLGALQDSGIDGWAPLHTGRQRQTGIPTHSKGELL